MHRGKNKLFSPYVHTDTHTYRERERYVILLLFFLIFFDTKSVLQVLVSSASDKPLMEQPFRDLLVTGTLLP